jgi:hypothetical protein
MIVAILLISQLAQAGAVAERYGQHVDFLIAASREWSRDQARMAEAGPALEAFSRGQAAIVSIESAANRLRALSISEEGGVAAAVRDFHALLAAAEAAEELRSGLPI